MGSRRPLKLAPFLLHGFVLLATFCGAALADSGPWVRERLETGAGRFPWFHVRAGQSGPVQRILIILHGHARDMNDSLAAGIRVAEQAGTDAGILVVAPLFPVRTGAAACSRADTPAFEAGDAEWTCSDWQEGGLAHGSALSAFAAMDRLLAELGRRWPEAHQVTLAGFSAGGQFVQRYAGFAQIPAAMRLRFVVADPGSWLYPDDRRPQPVKHGEAVDWRACTAAAGEGACDFTWSVPADCPAALDWKFGLRNLPAHLALPPETLQARRAAADIVYLEGALDTGEGPGSAYRILDKSCGARAQGPYRLQRGLAFAAHENTFIRPDRPAPLIVIPGCGHQPACVLTSPLARPWLLPSATSVAH